MKECSLREGGRNAAFSFMWLLFIGRRIFFPMKITKTQLRQIIKEELGHALKENEAEAAVEDAVELVNNPEAEAILDAALQDPKIAAQLKKVASQIPLEEDRAPIDWKDPRALKRLHEYLVAAGMGSWLGAMTGAMLGGSAAGLSGAALATGLGAGAGLGLVALYLASRTPGSGAHPMRGTTSAPPL